MYNIYVYMIWYIYISYILYLYISLPLRFVVEIERVSRLIRYVIFMLRATVELSIVENDVMLYKYV